MKPTWKNVIRCAVFILLLVLLLSLLSRLFVPRSIHASYDLNNYHYSGIYGEPKDSLDALIIGNSLSYMGISPIEMWERRGIASFVCGNAMQYIDTTYDHLVNTLKVQSPRVIAMECDTLYWEIDWEDLFRTKLSMAFPVFSFHDMWRKVPKSVLLGKPFPRYIDDAKGYYPKDGTSTCDTAEYMSLSDSVTPIPEANKKCLEDIVKLCRQKNIELVLFSVPSPVNWDYSKHNAVQAFADQWGLTYRDLNLEWKQIGLDFNQHSWDSGDHMNIQGGILLSEFLADWLADSYELPDRREDPDYAQWNISAKNYHGWVWSDTEHRVPPLREIE